MEKIIIPAGRLADDEMLKRKREELKQKLLREAQIEGLANKGLEPIFIGTLVVY